MSQVTETTDRAGAARRFRELAALVLEKCAAESLEACNSAMATWLCKDLGGQTSFFDWLYHDKAEEKAQRQRRQCFTLLRGGKQ